MAAGQAGAPAAPHSRTGAHEQKEVSQMNTITALLAERVTDASGREWARKTNGTWACLGHAITVDNIRELEANYGIESVES